MLLLHMQIRRYFNKICDNRLIFTKPELFYFRSIGVCNFGIHHLEGLKSACLPTPAINQIELHPWQRKLDIVRYCNENGIAVMAYSPLVKGNQFEDETLLQIAKRYMTVLDIYFSYNYIVSTHIKSVQM